MGLLTPITAVITAGIAVPLLVLLYFLKRRRREVAVSSTMLWSKAIEDMRVNAPFQKLRRSLLLLLQLLVLAALILALARPALRATGRPGDRVVIVVDRSASMKATDVAPSRFGQATDAALALIDGLDDAGDNSGSNGAMVIGFAHRASVAQPFTTDRALLRNAVRSLEPTDQPGRLDEALRLVRPFVGRSAAAADPLIVYVIGDSRIDRDTLRGLAGVDVRFIRVCGEEPDNLGIVSLSARRAYEDPSRTEVFARVAYCGRKQITANLTLRINDIVERVVSATLPPAAPGTDGISLGTPSTRSIQFAITRVGSATITLEHDHRDDLDSDNRAYLSLAPPARLGVALISDGNTFLQRVIEASGVRALSVLTPTEYENQSGGAYDVLVFDRYAPRNTPRVHSIYLGAAPPIAGLELKNAGGEGASGGIVLDWKRDHPLLRFVVFDDLLMAQPHRLALPRASQILATSQSGPVMAQVIDGGVRHVVVGFDPLRSNWPMQIGFPVFISNAMQWLGLNGQTEAGIAFQPGQTVAVPGADNTKPLVYRGPVTLTGENDVPDASRAAFRMLGPLDRVGLYQSNAAMSPPWDFLAVNLSDADESDLRLATELAPDTPNAALASVGHPASIQKEVWRWFVGAALALMMIEWVVYCRRMHL